MIILRLLPLLGLARCYFDYANPYWECPVFDLNLVCIDRCETVQLQCILNCPADDVNCLSGCIREETECIKTCPCELYCHEGCVDCENPVCNCAEKRENDQWNRCIDENGSTLGRCIYDCEENESCETDCLNQFKARQRECPCEVSKIDGCQLVRQADMEFDFYVGSRQYHVSITVGTETMVIGGGVSESSAITEVWELEIENQKVVDPTLTDYRWGIVLYPVNQTFCKK